MASWWERFPERLEAELEDLTARDLDFELDEGLCRDAGRVLLRGSIRVGDRDIELEVLYPDLFPYLRPEVYAPELSLTRHQNPVSHNLCLLEGTTAAWRPEQTAAWLVAERVPLLLSLFEQGSEAMAEAEVPQAEPVSSYFRGVSGTVVLIPAEALSLDPVMRVGSGRLWFSPETPPRLALRALLGELVVRTGTRKTKLVARAADQLAKRFGASQIQMRWVRLDAAPDRFDAHGVLAAAEAVQPGFGRPPWQTVADGQIAVTGVVFPEEVRQGVEEDAWLFGVRIRRSSAGQLHEDAYLVRGDRFTLHDLGERIPKLAPLRDATIAQIGLGAVGAPLALELVRNQVGELRLLEHDHVEASQVVRWPMGLSAVGAPKLEAIARWSEQNYPFTRVERFQHRLGQTALERHGRSEDEADLVERLLDGASLVIDASAELGIQQLVSDFAHQRGLIQIYASATEGARGGQVALIAPGRGGCWYCWKRHALEGAIPLPPLDEAGTVQPRGCTSLTFTGASFDLLPVTLQAARVAATAVRPDEPLGSTVFICGLPEDAISPPAWSTHPIPVHGECARCASLR